MIENAAESGRYLASAAIDLLTAPFTCTGLLRIDGSIAFLRDSLRRHPEELRHRETCARTPITSWNSLWVYPGHTAVT
jgi:hypothetical protein